MHMPRVTGVRLLAVEQLAVWDFIKDMGNWAPFIMGYQTHKVIDESHSTWTVKGELGAFARTVSFDVEITEWVIPDLVSFQIQGVTEEFQGVGSVAGTGFPGPAGGPRLELGRSVVDADWTPDAAGENATAE
jgi:carbon monoxide dehydrogenase subunit G